MARKEQLNGIEGFYLFICNEKLITVGVWFLVIWCQDLYIIHKYWSGSPPWLLLLFCHLSTVAQNGQISLVLLL